MFREQSRLCLFGREGPVWKGGPCFQIGFTPVISFLQDKILLLLFLLFLSLCRLFLIYLFFHSFPFYLITTFLMLNKDRPTDVTCFIFSSTCFECQYIHLQELATVCGYTALGRCVLALGCGSAGVVWYPYAG